MNTISRRTIITRIAALPFIGALTKLDLFAHAGPAWPVTTAGSRMMALNTLRFLNTAQRWHQRDTGRFATLAELSQSVALLKVANDSFNEKKGFGKSLYDQLRLNDVEVIPGWQLKFGVQDGGKGYSTAIYDVDGESVAIFTDDTGRIYDYEAPESDSLPSAAHAEMRPVSLTGRRARFSRATAFFKAAVLLPVTGWDDCCSDHMCCCDGYCGSGCMSNCGCLACTWCCPKV